MRMLTLPQTWLANTLRPDERGQGTTEYVLLILGVALFLLVAAFALQGILNGTIDKISTWISTQNAP